MLKGHVFQKQIFGNPIFALFINTFLNGQNGVSNNYKNGMAVTYSGSSVTVDSGAICIQGRFLEEDTSTTVDAGTDEAYCKLVIEIDLDKQNTDTEFLQGSYKIVKSGIGYPTLTQTDIVKNNTGIYQYELARFRTGTNGISEMQDMRTYIDYNSIYKMIEEKIKDIEDESIYILKEDLIYSNEEKVIGKWIDGKSIYRKVIEVGDMSIPSVDTVLNIAHNISNFGTLIDIKLRMTFSGALQYSYWNGIGRIMADSTNIKIVGKEPATFTNVFVIIEYTKTTE